MKFLFYLMPYIKPTEAYYQHQEVCLAEGFRDLGIEYYGNINYWVDLEKNSFLIKEAPKDFVSSINIYSSSYFTQHYDHLKLDNNKFNILIDNEDGYTTCCQKPKAENFNLILRSHFSRKKKYNGNVVPWAFGLSNRIIQASQKFSSSEIKNQVYINYRVSHNLRDLADKRMIDILKQRFKILYQSTESLKVKVLPDVAKYDYWNQTGRRHNPVYYEILNQSLLTFTFGGILEYKSSFHRFKEAIEKRIHYYGSNNFNIIQFDSWRLWEGFLSNSCPVNIDLENWEVELPEMPVNGIHYLGVKGTHFEKYSTKIINTDIEEIKTIGLNGKEWVLANYAPKPTSQRLINLLKL